MTTPIVVFVPGAGDTTASYAHLMRRLPPGVQVILAQRTRLVTQSRAPRGTAALALDHYLDDLARSVKGRDRLLLVGHSLGGLLAATFALRHPDRVAGLVLLDATPLQAGDDRAVRAGFAVSGALARALRALTPFGVSGALLRMRLMPAYPEQRAFQAHQSAAEREAWRRGVLSTLRRSAAEELTCVLNIARTAAVEHARHSDPRLGDLPLVVVASAAYGGRWLAWQERWTDLSSWHRLRHTGDRSHNIHLRHPALVATAIADIVREVERRRSAEAAKEEGCCCSRGMSERSTGPRSEAVAGSATAMSWPRSPAQGTAEPPGSPRWEA